MKSRLLLPLIAILIILLVNPVASQSDKEQINSFIVYYGDLTIVKNKFPNTTLAIISSIEDPSIIKDKNNIIIGYLSITTIGGWEPWAKNVTKDMIIGEYHEWGEPIINVSDPRWHNIILETAIPFIISKGFNGVLLDNLDIAEIHPEIRESLISLIKEIRTRYPNLTIVVNRGFIITEEISNYINGILFEDYGSYYDMSNHEYRVYTNGQLITVKQILKKIMSLSKEKGFYVLGLAYGEPEKPGWKEILSTVCELDKPYKNPVYIGDAYLNKIGVINPCEEHVESTGSNETTMTTGNIGKENTLTKTLLPVITLIIIIIYIIYSSRKE